MIFSRRPSGPSFRERQGNRMRKFPPLRHPGQGREAPAEPGSIGRKIVRNDPVLASAGLGTLVASPEPGRAAQWIPDSLRFAPASGMTGTCPAICDCPAVDEKKEDGATFLPQERVSAGR
jgi:hypothetical protein